MGVKQRNSCTTSPQHSTESYSLLYNKSATNQTSGQSNLTKGRIAAPTLTVFPILYNGPPLPCPPKLAPSHGDIWLLIYYVFPCAQLIPQIPQSKGHLDRFSSFAGLTIVTDRLTDRPTDGPTDRATPSVTINCIYVRSTV